APQPEENKATAEFNRLVDEYFDFYFRINPSQATAAGFHQYDDQLEESSASAVKEQIAGLLSFRDRFLQLPADSLPQESAADLSLLENSIQAQLLDLQDIQTWRRDPDIYSSGLTSSIFLIMKRNFAPPEERLKSVIARERKASKFLVDGGNNLRNPPKVFTEVALQQLPGVIDFFQHDVPKAFAEVKDPALLAEFKASNQGAITALQKYQAFVKNKVLPTSHGDFRIGAENYRKKLLYEEMVDIPLDRLLEIGYADLRRNQEKLREVAAQIDPKHSPEEVITELQKDHPAPDQLLQSFRDVLGSLHDFIEQKKIITIPSTIVPEVEETPPFMTALSTASMDTPGAYETRATEALFNVTLPEHDWKPEHVREWMESFNRGMIVSTATHEVYPGHYVQFLWVKQAPSKVRKLLSCGSNAEGWAHYTEQMMLDEGYGNGDPKLRLGQIEDALLRDARFIAGIEMHTGKMTLAQAKQFFITEGHQLPAVATPEATRGTSDPTYLVYTLGKLQILKLREDYRKAQGDKFSLQEFHDRLMQQGAVPLKIIRRTMLGDDSPTL
ncbi:MAG: DUF885 domain-containing protein, partial [Acidobacteriales bacterium]|nr:DUF885 domain-containing protein [Terriglobales bacterium]